MKNKSTQTRWYTRNFLQYWGVPDWIQNFLHELLEGDQSRMPTGGMVRFRWDIKQVRVGRGKQEKECDRADVTENSLREIQSQGGRRKTEQDTRGCMRGPGRAGVDRRRRCLASAHRGSQADSRGGRKAHLQNEPGLQTPCTCAPPVRPIFNLLVGIQWQATDWQIVRKKWENMCFDQTQRSK